MSKKQPKLAGENTIFLKDTGKVLKLTPPRMMSKKQAKPFIGKLTGLMPETEYRVRTFNVVGADDLPPGSLKWMLIKILTKLEKIIQAALLKLTVSYSPFNPPLDHSHCRCVIVSEVELGGKITDDGKVKTLKPRSRVIAKVPIKRNRLQK